MRYFCTNCQYELISEEDIEGEVCEACNAGTMSCEEAEDEEYAPGGGVAAIGLKRRRRGNKKYLHLCRRSGVSRRNDQTCPPGFLKGE